MGITRHLDRAVHPVYGVDLTPVRSQGGDCTAFARYLGKIQLEMTRQDLKESRADRSWSPWDLALSAAETGNKQHAALWIEYLRATKGRHLVSFSASLAETYGEPTDEHSTTTHPPMLYAADSNLH